MAFTEGWARLTSSAWKDTRLKGLFRGEGCLGAVSTGTVPIPSRLVGSSTGCPVGLPTRQAPLATFVPKVATAVAAPGFTTVAFGGVERFFWAFVMTARNADLSALRIPKMSSALLL